MELGLPKVQMDDTVKAAIKEAFKAAKGKRELCGVLIGYKESDTFVIDGFREVENSAKKKGTFSIKRKQIRRALGLGKKDPLTQIIGSVHTHNGKTHPDPSVEDVEQAPAGTINAVYHVKKNLLTYYTNEDGFIVKEGI